MKTAHLEYHDNNDDDDHDDLWWQQQLQSINYIKFQNHIID